MNRRFFFSKLPLLGSVLVAPNLLSDYYKPQEDYILNAPAPQCPSCLWVFDCSIKQDPQGNYLNWDPETQTVILEHPKFRYNGDHFNCPLAGKKFRYKLPRTMVEVIS